MGNAGGQGLGVYHQMIGGQLEKGLQLLLGTRDSRIQVARTETDRVDRPVVPDRTGKEMSYACHEIRLRAGTAGRGNIDVLADQPAAETQPDSEAAHDAVLHRGLVVAAEVYQRGLLALAIDLYPADQLRALPDTTHGIEFDGPFQGRSQGVAVEHTQGDQAHRARRRRHVGHNPAGLIAEPAKQFRAQPAVLLPRDKGCLGAARQRVKGKARGVQNGSHLQAMGPRLDQQGPGELNGDRFVIRLRGGG